MIEATKDQPTEIRNDDLNFLGSTISTNRYMIKINPKDCQVASPLVIQCFSNFLGLFQLMKWQTPFLAGFVVGQVSKLDNLYTWVYKKGLTPSKLEKKHIALQKRSLLPPCGYKSPPQFSDFFLQQIGVSWPPKQQTYRNTSSHHGV